MSWRMRGDTVIRLGCNEAEPACCQLNMTQRERCGTGSNLPNGKRVIREQIVKKMTLYKSRLEKNLLERNKNPSLFSGSRSLCYDKTIVSIIDLRNKAKCFFCLFLIIDGFGNSTF